MASASDLVTSAHASTSGALLLAADFFPPLLSILLDCGVEGAVLPELPQEAVNASPRQTNNSSKLLERDCSDQLFSLRRLSLTVSIPSPFVNEAGPGADHRGRHPLAEAPHLIVHAY